MNKLGFTIRIFAAGAELEGLRIVEKSNWSGKGIVCPRSLLRVAKSRNEFGRPAVYMLTGPSTDSTLPRVYIGEGDPVGPRLESHAAKKDFWTTVILFCSKDENLNKAHIQYLESRLVDLAREARTAELDNSTAPELPSLSEIDSAEAEGFLQEMLLCLPLIGVQAFQKAESSVIPSALLELRGKGIKAHGLETPAGFIVLKGSLAVPDVVPSVHGYIRELRKTLFDQGIFKVSGDAWELTRNYRFDSPSTAASLMLGRSANGRIEWKDRAGHTLKEIQDGAIVRAHAAKA